MMAFDDGRTFSDYIRKRALLMWCFASMEACRYLSIRRLPGPSFCFSVYQTPLTTSKQKSKIRRASRQYGSVSVSLPQLAIGRILSDNIYK
eukprot:6875785-Karenia_brevis.AAC.1